VPRDDSFRTTKKVCRQLEAGVQAIFGPTDALLAGHVQSICEAYDIPHIEVRIDLEYSSKEFSINLYPSHTLLTLAYRDIMMYLNWTKVAIIYEEDYGNYHLHIFFNGFVILCLKTIQQLKLFVMCNVITLQLQIVRFRIVAYILYSFNKELIFKFSEYPEVAVGKIGRIASVYNQIKHLLGPVS